MVFVACDNGGSNNSGGTYSGKDVLGNSYSLSVGSNARTVSKGDSFSMDLGTRDGKTRTVKGTVDGISADGTLTLKPNGGGRSFNAVVGGNNLNSLQMQKNQVPNLNL